MKKANRFFLISLFLFVFSTVNLIFSTRIIDVECVLCKENIDQVSIIEYYRGPFTDIPCFHTICNNYVCEFYAPNCDMTLGEWLEIRGWNPRPEETKGKTWKKIME